MRKRNVTLSNQKRRNLILYCCLALIPIINFIVFYLIVNIRSIFLAFQDYDSATNSFVWLTDDIFKNFREFIVDLRELPQLKPIWKNSVIIYFTGLFVSTPLTILFSYYIYRKYLLHNTIKVIIYLPSIVSGVALVLMFRYFVNSGIPYVMKQLFGKELQEGLLNTEETAFGTLLFYGIWGGLGGGTLLYIGGMNQINDSLLEASELDGAGSFQQFIHIAIPKIFPMMSVFLGMGITGIIFSGFDLYTFFGLTASQSLYSLGYYLMKLFLEGGNPKYPYLSAVALLQTLVAIPMVYTARFLLNKYGPKDD